MWPTVTARRHALLCKLPRGITHMVDPQLEQAPHAKHREKKDDVDNDRRSSDVVIVPVRDGRGDGCCRGTLLHSEHTHIVDRTYVRSCA